MNNDKKKIFDEQLRSKFYELRPLLSEDIKTLDKTAGSDPIFQKLWFLDKTITDPDVFETGYVIWLNSDENIDNFIDSFVVKWEDGIGITIKPKEDDPASKGS